METEKRESIRLALIASEYTLSEYWNCLEHLLAGLADESISVGLVCPQGWDVSSLVFGNVEVIRYPAVALPLCGHLNARILLDNLVRFKPTVIHCLCETYAALTRRLSAELEVPYVLSVNSLHRRFLRPQVSSARCAKIIVPTESIALNTAQLHPQLADRIRRVSPGVFTSDSGSFSDSGRIVSIVMSGPSGHLSEIENVLAAAKRLIIGGYEFLLVIITGQAGDKGIWRLLSRYGLSHIATIVPRMEPWRPIMEGADVFVQAWPSAEFGCLMLEAMASGVAVAACRGGVDDLVLEGKTCAVFEPEDELSVFGVIKGFLDGRDEARRLAAGAQEYVQANHSVGKMVAQMLETYSQAAAWYE